MIGAAPSTQIVGVLASPPQRAGKAGEVPPCASPADLLGDTPSGQDCLDALGRWGRVHGLSMTRALALAGLPTSAAGNLRVSNRPKDSTVARVRALVSLDAVPASQLPRPPVSPPAGDGRSHHRVHPAAPPVSIEHPAPARPSISIEVAREAEALAHKRAAARFRNRSSEIESTPMPRPAAVQAGLLTTPNDAMRALITAWPRVWQRLVEQARAAGVLPGVYFFDAVERGLDLLVTEEAAT